MLQNKTSRSLNNWDGKPSSIHRILLSWLLQILICSILNLDDKNNCLCTVRRKLPYSLVPMTKLHQHAFWIEHGPLLFLIQKCIMIQVMTWAQTVIQIKFILSRQHSEKHNAFLAKCWLSAKLFTWPAAISILLGLQVNRTHLLIFLNFLTRCYRVGMSNIVYAVRILWKITM